MGLRFRLVYEFPDALRARAVPVFDSVYQVSPTTFSHTGFQLIDFHVVSSPSPLRRLTYLREAGCNWDQLGHRWV